MRKIKLMAALFSASLIISGCSLVSSVDAGNPYELPEPELVAYGRQADVQVATPKGILTEKITVTEPHRAMGVNGKKLPNIQTASWFTFDIKGAKEFSDMYASDLDGAQIDFGPANDCIFFGRVYKLDNGYGVLIPNGYGTSLTDANGNIRLKSGDINIRIGDKIFTGRK